MSPDNEPRFSWRGTTKWGDARQGEHRAAGASLLIARLRREGITVTHLRKRRTGSARGAIPGAVITVFTRQLATLLRCGVMLHTALEILSQGDNRTRLPGVLRELRRHISEGHSFTQALAQHPRHFDSLYRGLVATGEQSGALAAVLEQLAHHREQDQRHRQLLLRATRYPCIVAAISLLVALLLLVTVIPQFAHIYASLGEPLPASTQALVSLSGWLRAYGVWLGAGLCAAGALLAQHRGAWLSALGALSRHLPVWGQIRQLAYQARFSRALGTALGAQLPLREALAVVCGIADRRSSAQLHEVQQGLLSGLLLHQALAGRADFTAMLRQMVRVGEEIGSLESMLQLAAEYYDGEVERHIERLSAFLEPAIMVCMGLLIGAMMVAMYIPILRMGTAV